MIKNLPAMQETWGWSLCWEVPPWRGAWQSTPVFLPEEFHGQRNPVGYSTWGSQRVGQDWATNTQSLIDQSIWYSLYGPSANKNGESTIFGSIRAYSQKALKCKIFVYRLFQVRDEYVKWLRRMNKKTESDSYILSSSTIQTHVVRWFPVPVHAVA